VAVPVHVQTELAAKPGPPAVRTFFRFGVHPESCCHPGNRQGLRGTFCAIGKLAVAAFIFSLIIFFHLRTSLQGLASRIPPPAPASTLRDILFAACSQTPPNLPAPSPFATEAFPHDARNAHDTPQASSFSAGQNPASLAPNRMPPESECLLHHFRRHHPNANRQTRTPDNLPTSPWPSRMPPLLMKRLSSRAAWGLVREPDKGSLLGLLLLICPPPESGCAEIKNKSNRPSTHQEPGGGHRNLPQNLHASPDNLVVLGPPPQGPRKAKRPTDRRRTRRRTQGWLFLPLRYCRCECLGRARPI